MPIWVWGIIFIGGSIVGVFARRRYLFILFVSIPLALFSSFVLVAFFKSAGLAMTGVVTYLALALASASFAGNELKL